MADELSITDLSRPMQDVAAALPAWQRGDADEAVAATLDLAARNAHARAYVAWVWEAMADDGTAVWLLPVRPADADAWSPRGPITILTRTLRAAADCGAEPDAIRAFDWDGFVALRVPGADPLLAPIALADAHPRPARSEFAAVALEVDGPPIQPTPPRSAAPGGLADLAAATRCHPLRLVGPLMAQGWGLEEPAYPPEVVDMLRHRGLQGPRPSPDAPSLAIEDDPCPRRRDARRLLRRLLHKRKIGAQYHTAFDHLAHGVAPEQRADAYAIGEALIRAGLLGEKPSVGQRHVYLRREALPRIHALIERGETDDAQLATEWTAPGPGRPDTRL